MSHPSLGLPPRDARSGFPDAAAKLTRNRAMIGQRALEIAVDRDPGFRDRHDELALRRLLRDTEIFIDRLALSVGSNDPKPMGVGTAMWAGLAVGALIIAGLVAATLFLV